MRTNAIMETPFCVSVFSVLSCNGRAPARASKLRALEVKLKQRLSLQRYTAAERSFDGSAFDAAELKAVAGKSHLGVIQAHSPQHSLG
jgi:hypothetical protein